LRDASVSGRPATDEAGHALQYWLGVRVGAAMEGHGVQNDEGDTRERIQAVALARFREQGASKTSLREIAEELHVSKAALYYYFRTKDELIASLATPFLDGFAALLDEAKECADGDLARPLVEGYLDLLFEQRSRVQWLRDDNGARAHPLIAPRLIAMGQRFRQLLGGSEMSFEEKVRIAAAIGALGTGVVEFPEAEATELREPLLRAAWAVLGQD
jgi:AcrR family transcriptional regulator